MGGALASAGPPPSSSATFTLKGPVDGVQREGLCSSSSSASLLPDCVLQSLYMPVYTHVWMRGSGFVCLDYCLAGWKRGVLCDLCL